MSYLKLMLWTKIILIINLEKKIEILVSITPNNHQNY